jgi:hypothetical protein
MKKVLIPTAICYRLWGMAQGCGRKTNCQMTEPWSMWITTWSKHQASERLRGGCRPCMVRRCVARRCQVLTNDIFHAHDLVAWVAYERGALFNLRNANITMLVWNNRRQRVLRLRGQMRCGALGPNHLHLWDRRPTSYHIANTVTLLLLQKLYNPINMTNTTVP